MEPNTPPKPTRIARAYLGLARDFARDHRFITVGLLATVAVHAAYEIWNRAVQPGEAPLALRHRGHRRVRRGDHRSRRRLRKGAAETPVEY